MNTIERLREFEHAATTPRLWNPEEVGEAFRWFRKMGGHNTFTTQDGELAAAAVNALPALLAVVEAAAKLVVLRDADCSPDWVENELKAEDELKAALRALEGGN